MDGKTISEAEICADGLVRVPQSVMDILGLRIGDHIVFMLQEDGIKVVGRSSEEVKEFHLGPYSEADIHEWIQKNRRGDLTE